MKTLHVTGFKNSGKTTLVAHWVELLAARGIETAVLKHHGHGGQPALAENTDTTAFMEAGAASAVVSGGGMIQWVQKREYTFEQLKALAAYGGADVLLIEGYKHEQGEKLALIREPADRAELEALDGVIYTADSAEIFADTAALDEWLLNWLEGK